MARAAAEARRSRAVNLAVAVVALFVLAFTWRQTEVDAGLLVAKMGNIGRVLGGFAHPSWGSFRDPILASTLQTIYIAVLGTALGTLIAIPISFLAARNLMRRSAVGTALYFAIRFAMSIIRSTPTLVWGILWVIVVGIGPFPGVLAVTTFTVGLMSKLFSEAIEAADWGQVEAITATGAAPLQVVRFGVVPQVVPYMIAQVLYSFEVNIHSSTVLGIVGAGGLGLILEQYIGLFDYPDLAMWLITVIVMTSIIDYSSAAIRRRLI